VFFTSKKYALNCVKYLITGILLTVLYLDYEDLSYCYCLVGLVSFNALAIEWLIVSRCFAGSCVGLTVLTAGVLLMPVVLYI
jgi:hypothetical protein